jgi:uncharacterized protein YdaU (DUF1376 family)
MRTPAPAFQAYANELLGLIIGLSLPSQGAVLRLMLVAWIHSPDQYSLKNDDTMLARIVGVTEEEWRIIRAEMELSADRVFKERNGILSFPYLKREAQKQLKFRKQQAEKGKRSAELRFNRGSTNALPQGNSSSSSSFSSSSPSSVKNKAQSPSIKSQTASNKPVVWEPMPENFREMVEKHRQ